MRYDIEYGPGLVLTVEPSPRTRIDDCRLPQGQAIDDVSGAVVAALAQPLEYPSLASSTVPGDKVVIAVEPGLRQIENIVAGTLISLLEAGAQPRDVSLVVASNLRPPLALVPKGVRQDVRVILHNPADQDGLQYLAADKEARPIYLNRAICEADFLLPVTTARHTASLGYVGGYAGVFPTFADTATQERFQAPSSTDHSTQQRRRRAEADEAAWLLGVHFTMQVVPGTGDHVLGIVAGQAKAVNEQAEHESAAAWQHRVARRASMVIAAIDGGADQQTWENLARAVHCAMQVAVEGGAIVILSDLSAPSGAALAKLAGSHQGDQLQHDLEREHSADAHAAAILAEARERFDVYLLSGLDADLVEAVGLGYVETPHQVAHLAASHSSIALIGSAQFASCEVPLLVS